MQRQFRAVFSKRYAPVSADPFSMEIEIQGLNPVLGDMVQRGQLTPRKIALLVELRGGVDRFTSTDYVSAQQAEELRARYGAYPEVRTWGDYFQTEIASQHFEVSDSEFSTIMDTVRFDLISAAMIFDGKPADFLEKVEENAIIVQGIDRSDWNAETEEAAHMGILRQYFVEMGLSRKSISAADETWFHGFAASAQAV